MPKTRPPYAAEFRQQMVDLVRSGRAPEDLAREFEPSSQAIRTWVAQAGRDAGERSDGLRTEEREELRRLRRENRRLCEEREILAKATAWFARDGSGKMERTPHHFASVFLRRRDGGRDGREVTGWRMDAAGAVDAKTRPPRLGHAADDVPTAPTSRFVIGLAKAWRMSIESVCYEFTR